MKHTVKTGLEVSVGAEDKKRLSNRRLIVVITLIVSVLCALVIGYNAYQDFVKNKPEQIAVVYLKRSPMCRNGSICKEITVKEVRNIPLTENAKSEGVTEKTKILMSVVYGEWGNWSEKNVLFTVKKFKNSEPVVYFISD